MEKSAPPAPAGPTALQISPYNGAVPPIPPRVLLGLTTALWVLACWRAGPPWGDFANYYTAADIWWTFGRDSEELTRLYDFRFFNDHTARAGFGDRLSGFPILTPPSALLAAPLLFLSAAGAGKAWWVLQGITGWLTGVVTARSLGRPAWAGVAALAVIWPALRGHFSQGQFHLPAVLCLALGFAAWQSKRPLLTGLTWGLAIGLKVHAWPLLIVACCARRWRTVAAIFGTLLIGGLGSVAILGWSLHAVWLTEIVPASSGGWWTDPWHVTYQSIHPLTRALFSPHPAFNPTPPLPLPGLATALATGLHLGAIGLTAAHALSWQSATATTRRRLLSAAAIVAMVTGPVLATYHLVLLFPPLLWAVDGLWRDGRRGRAAVVVTLTLLAGFLPIPHAWPDSVPGMIAAIPRGWALLALWAALLPWSRRGAALGGVALVFAAVLAVKAADRGDPTRDGAVPIDGAGFPLIAADLVRTDDGSLWFSGMRQDRGGFPGAGFLGFRLRPGAATPEAVAGDERAHVWSPQPTGPDTVAWETGSTGAPLSTAATPCRGGQLTVADVDGFAQVFWQPPGGAPAPLTDFPAHHADPVCDGDQVIVLSDRGAGVRALRLWRIPLP